MGQLNNKIDNIQTYDYFCLDQLNLGRKNKSSNLKTQTTLPMLVGFKILIFLGWVGFLIGGWRIRFNPTPELNIGHIWHFPTSRELTTSHLSMILILPLVLASHPTSSLELPYSSHLSFSFLVSIETLNLWMFEFVDVCIYRYDKYNCFKFKKHDEWKK